MFDHLLELSHRNNSNKWSNIGCGEEITQVESIGVHFTHVSSYNRMMFPLNAIKRDNVFKKID